MSYCYARFFGGSRPVSNNYEGDFEFYGQAQNVYNYLSGLSSSNITWFINNSSPTQNEWNRFLDLLESNLNTLCGGGIPQTPFIMFTFGNKNEYLTYFLGKRFTFDLRLYVNSDLAIRFDFAFSDSNPSSTNIIPDCNISYFYDNVCSRVDSQTLSEQIQELKDAWSSNRNSLIFNLVSGFTSSPWNGVDCVPHDYNPPVQCEDLRNSENQQSLHLVVSDGQNNVTTTDITFNLSDGANQELALRTYMNDTVYNYFNNIYNQNQDVKARIMFNGGVCRSACTVRIVAKVYGQAVSVEPSLMPPYVTLDNDILAGQDVDILRATFEECNDKPVRIEEDLVPYLNGLKSQNFFSVGFSIYQVVPYKIVITGCEALTEWCCDDVTPIEDDSIDYNRFEEPLIQGYGVGSDGGGSDVDLTCICDGLSRINNSLIAFKEANQGALASIDSAIQNISIEGGSSSSCICDNLENISDGVIAIKEAIDDKNLSVVNNNTVQPPVNNISVQPPVNNISLPTTQLENIATNTRALNCVCASLENLEVIQQGTKESIDGVRFNLQCGKDDNISCILDNVNSNISNIADSLVCGNNGIACVLQGKDMSVDVDLNTTDITNGLEAITEKLDDIENTVHDGLINSDDESNLENISQSLNTSDDEPISLADVIKDKDMGTNIDVEVSPADDVNINRVYYTNQRNGETNI